MEAEEAIWYMWLEVNFWANLGNKRNNKRSRKVSPINLWSQRYTQITNFLLPSHSARSPVVGTGLPTTLLISRAPSVGAPQPNAHIRIKKQTFKATAKNTHFDDVYGMVGWCNLF